MRYVLDTNVFNRVTDGLDLTKVLPDGAQLVATYVQKVEIENTRDAARRAHLLKTFRNVDASMAPTETGFWDEAPWGETKWSNDTRFDKIYRALEAKKSKPNNRQDAQIAEVAVANGWTLVTADVPLAQVAASLGCKVITIP